MKILIREYLAALKEREELDAILPDLLSELGFTVLSRPGRGTRQQGVDVAAVGEDEDGERKVFLFSVKAGDLTRQDWDGTPQALRSSLNQIRDAYIRNRIPTRYKDLKIVICLVFGGDVHEQVREELRGYIEDNSTKRISFDEWNGDKLAGLILDGILREEILPKSMRSCFQKSVAMLDEPDVSYKHFRRLAEDLRSAGTSSAKARVRSARQFNICLWILFVWARDIDNLEAPYRASELALLSIWELLRPTIGQKGRTAKSLNRALNDMIGLHLTIASELEGKVMPHAQVWHGLSLATDTQSPVDVNLALFKTLGRIGLTGLWTIWLGNKGSDDDQKFAHHHAEQLIRTGLFLIQNNPALFLPITDHEGTDIALFLLLCEAGGVTRSVAEWLGEMARRMGYTMRTRGRYPSCGSDYRDLAEHPRNSSDEYFEEATAGSTLIPLIAAWLEGLGEEESVELLRTLVREELQHCTLQLWMPDAVSENELYVGNSPHGRALCDLSLDEGGAQLLTVIAEACRSDTDLSNLSAMQADFWPLVLTACRHHRLPIPPGFWIESLLPPPQDASAEHP